MKTDLNGKVLQRLRSTAANTVLPQAGLARNPSPLSAALQLEGPNAGPPSISSLGALAGSTPQLNRWGLHYLCLLYALPMAALI